MRVRGIYGSRRDVPGLLAGAARGLCGGARRLRFATEQPRGNSATHSIGAGLGFWFGPIRQGSRICGLYVTAQD